MKSARYNMDDDKTFNPYEAPAKKKLSPQEQLNKWLKPTSQMDDLADEVPESNVTGLYLSGRRFQDYTHIASFVHLQRLDLSMSNVANLNGFEHLRALRWLSLAKTDVSDLSQLAGLESLEHLDLSYCLIKDFSQLAPLPNLKILILRGTSITDLSPVSKATQLEQIDLKATPIESVAELRRLPNLKRVTVDQAITDRLKAKKRKGRKEPVYLVDGIDAIDGSRSTRPATLMIDDGDKQRRITLEYGEGD